MQDLSIKPAAPQPALVTVSKGKYLSMGKEYASAPDLMEVLKDSKVRLIRIGWDGGDDYESIGRLIFSAQRVGIDVKVEPAADT